MEDAVTDAILTGSTCDPALLALLELEIRARETRRPIFPDLLREPLLYRHFSGMVAAALEALRLAKELEAGGE